MMYYKVSEGKDRKILSFKFELLDLEIHLFIRVKPRFLVPDAVREYISSLHGNEYDYLKLK